MIKVALVSHTSAFAGAERMLYSLACLLKADDGFSPVVFLPGTQTDQSHFKEACEMENIPVVWMGSHSGYGAWYIYDGTSKDKMGRKRLVLRAVQDLEKQLAYLSVDMVVCNTATSLVPALAGAELGLPVVTWIHGIIDNANLPKECDARQRLLYDRILMALSAQTICCSEWTARFYRQLSPAPVEVVHNWTKDEAGSETQGTHEGAPSEQAGKREGFRFVCLNTFEHNKGLDTLLEAAKILVEKYHLSDFQIELYGDGASDFKKNMLDFIQTNKLAKRVFLRGRTNEISKVYQKADCLVQPSRLESFGMTIIEAMSHSRPVIATRSGGPSEIILDGDTGCLIDRDDAEALAEKMAYFMEHPGAAARMGASGREQYVEHFSEAAGKRAMIPLLKSAYGRCRELSAEQQLILDMTVHQLYADAGWTGASMPAETAPLPTSYNPYELCFSGILHKKRRYGITGQAGSLSGIEILLANLEGELDAGTLTLNLYQRGELLASAQCTGAQLNMQGWTRFSFPTVLTDGSLLTVELCPEGFEGLGVFEVRSKRGFFYKVFNKLGCPLKGQDVLKAALLP